MTHGYAAGKVILLGEHSVVYKRPAIAVPVTDVRVQVTIQETPTRPGVTILATDIGRTFAATAQDPLALTVRNTLAQIGVKLEQVQLSLEIQSSIPVASGLGSGAAVATAIVRALTTHLNHPLETATISAIVYETEQIYHGTPSGIDNTVIAFERPVYFCRGKPIITFTVKRPFWLAIADTGIPGLTKAAVADVRAAWQRDRATCEDIFDQIGALVDTARRIIREGQIGQLGALMNENQRLLRGLDVSSPELETLIEAAHSAGAEGAKLSGGGRGGNMIALIRPQQTEQVTQALQKAGAQNVIITQVGRLE